MTREALVIIAIVIIIILAVFGITFVKSFMGKPIRNVLHVPQGKTCVDVAIFDDKTLRPFKYGQTIEVQFLANRQTLTSVYTGAKRSDTGVLALKGVSVGFADSSSTYTHALQTLAGKYGKVLVGMTVLGIDAHDRPITMLQLPDNAWFTRALKNAL